LRDIDYATWRLLDSSDKELYRIYSLDGANDICAIIKLCEENGIKSIDILWVSDWSKLGGVKKMISTLALWAKKQGYSWIRFYTSGPQVSAGLRFSVNAVVRQPIFVFYSKDTTLLNRITEETSWPWELMDPDFENFLSENDKPYSTI
jgi:hypothetical protein